MFKRNKQKIVSSERNIDAYRLTAEGYERARRSGNPALSYDGALILSLLVKGQHTIGDIISRCGLSTGGHVISELDELISLGLVLKDDVVLHTEIRK